MANDFSYSNIKKGAGDVGLLNLGNTCFLNSVLQLLYSINDFQDFFRLSLFSEFLGKFKATTGRELSTSLGFLFKKVSESRLSVNSFEFVAVILKHWPEYIRYTQQDCHDFMCFLLWGLHNELQESAYVALDESKQEKDFHAAIKGALERRSASFITFLFAVQTVTSCSCNCGYNSIMVEDTLSVSLDVSDKTPTLKHCLDSHSRQETLADAVCPKCRVVGTFSRQMFFGRLPPYLIFHFKRFSQQGNTFTKINTMVNFPSEMSLQDYVAKDTQCCFDYKLIGVMTHVNSSSIHSGHYIAYCMRSNKWMEFNDAKVANTNLRKVCSSSAYVLLYQCKTQDKELNHDQLVRSSKYFVPQPLKVTDKITDAAVTQPPPSTPPEILTPIVPLDNTDVLPGGCGSPSQPTEHSTSNEADNCESTDDPPNLPPASTALRDCHHPAFNLDIEDPLLNQYDLPPEVFMDPSTAATWTVVNLQMWLKFRRLPQTGNKTQLIMKVLDCVKMGKDKKIYPGVDGGAWHKKKKACVSEDMTEADPLPALPVGLSVWKLFPSAHLPDLTIERVLEYFQGLPTVTYSNSQGVLSALEPDQEDSDSESDEYYTGEVQPKKADFTALCKRAVLQCIPRGEKILTSGHVQRDTVQDAVRGAHYFIKGQVRASMEKYLHVVTVTMESKSGMICTATCTCKASALKRCGHIAAILLMVIKHIEAKGHEAVTCTGRPCYWLKRPPGRDPGFISTKREYLENPLFLRRVTSNPFPRAYLLDHEAQEQAVKRYKASLKNDMPGCLSVYHFADIPNDSDEMSQEDDNANELYKELEVVAAQCSRAMWELNQVKKYHSGPFIIEGTMGQRDNPNWLKKRAMYATASTSQTLTGLRKDSAKVAFLRKHVWQLDHFVNSAIQEGIDNEPIARERYKEIMYAQHPDVKVEEAPSWGNTKAPQLSCSPDAIVELPSLDIMILLEVKVLTLDLDPNYYEEGMTAKQLAAFYLRKDENGQVILKRSHKYFRQIQQSLFLLEFETAHLFVWSKKGSLVVPVQRDKSYFEEKLPSIVARHRELIIPEHFLKRTLRHLPPIELNYLPFHEDENDDYFLINDL